MKNIIKGLAIAALALLSTGATAGSISDSYATGNTLTANHLNNIKTAVNDNDTRIAALEAALTTLQTDLATANTTIAATQADLATTQADLATANATIAALTTQQTTNTNDITSINNSNVLALDPFLTVDNTGNPKVILTGVNLQIVNGSGTTNTTNGLGNLIVGYDEVNTNTANLRCSDGQYADQATCETNGFVWSNSFKSGSHNLVLGTRNSYSSAGGMVAGSENFITRAYATVTGGERNTASGFYSFVGGGNNNIANGLVSSVSGGIDNTASGFVSSVSGGQANTASGSASSVSGGFVNTASGNVSTVSGGRTNTANGSSSSVSGGLNRSAIGNNNWVAGALSQAN